MSLSHCDSAKTNSIKLKTIPVRKNNAFRVKFFTNSSCCIPKGTPLKLDAAYFRFAIFVVKIAFSNNPGKSFNLSKRLLILGFLHCRLFVDSKFHPPISSHFNLAIETI